MVVIPVHPPQYNVVRLGRLGIVVIPVHPLQYKLVRLLRVKISVV
jgi:hypothetical protein